MCARAPRSSKNSLIANNRVVWMVSSRLSPKKKQRLLKAKQTRKGKSGRYKYHVLLFVKCTNISSYRGMRKQEAVRKRPKQNNIPLLGLYFLCASCVHRFGLLFYLLPTIFVTFYSSLCINFQFMLFKGVFCYSSWHGLPFYSVQ